MLLEEMKLGYNFVLVYIYYRYIYSKFLTFEKYDFYFIFIKI